MLNINMRTTIDLPEDLLRRAKATAALRGVKLKDLVARLLEDGLRNMNMTSQVGGQMGQRRPVPVNVSLGGTIPSLSNQEIDAIFLADDLDKLRRD